MCACVKICVHECEKRKFQLTAILRLLRQQNLKITHREQFKSRRKDEKEGNRDSGNLEVSKNRGKEWKVIRNNNKRQKRCGVGDQREITS